MSNEQQTRLELDIDTRLLWMWDKILESGELYFTAEELGAYIRAAYGQGWQDALTEEYGKLAKDNDFCIPPKLDE